mgnify:CR=1 FL=1
MSGKNKSSDGSMALDVKKERLLILQNRINQKTIEISNAMVGNIQTILVEGTSKKNPNEWKGRNTQNTVAVFEKGNYKLGDFVMVKVEDCTSATLKGTAIGYSDNN